MEPTMQGRSVLVTGATAGIGLETARELARLGADVTIVGRNPDKTRGVVEELRRSSGNPQVSSALADLSSLASIRALGAELRDRLGRLDVLVNNAGGMQTSRETTVDGLERTFATNHLGYFLLTNELLPLLRSSGTPERRSRIVSVASNAHRSTSGLDFDDLQAARSFTAWSAYCRSKLANVLFTRELARRLEGTPVTANSLHPGFVASNFLDKPGFWQVVKPIAYLFAIDNAAGAKTSIYLASSPEVEGVSGRYFVSCRERKPSSAAQDDAAARRLWEVSESLCGLQGGRVAA